jgi:hypothetical protein
MIEAFFQCDVAVNPDINAEDPGYVAQQIGCVVPNDEILEIADFLGLTIEDIFSVSMPYGFSRVGRVRCLVSADDIPALYRSTMNQQTNGVPSSVNVRHKVAAVFNWRHSENYQNGAERSYNQLPVWLLPPRPFHTVATERNPGGAAPDDGKYKGTGLFIVEAVDVRYWWSMAKLDYAMLDALHSRERMKQDAGFYNMSAAGQEFPNLTDALNALIGMLPVQRPIYSGTATAMLTNIELPPQMSVAMALDVILQQDGRYARRDGILNWSFRSFRTDRNYTTATQEVGILEGGYEAGSGTPVAPTAAPDIYSLNTLWEGAGGTPTSEDGNRYQYNRTPGKVGVAVEWRAVEGRTWRDRIGTSSHAVLGHDRKTIELVADIATDRSRPSIPTMQPMAHVEVPIAFQVDTAYARNTANVYAGGNLRLPADASAVADLVANQMSRRASAVYGRFIVPGWEFVAATALHGDGVFATVNMHTLRRLRGKLVPVSVRILDEDDWMLGPTGRCPEDPQHLVYARGNVSAKKVWGGALYIDVPSPVRRPFAARITSATRQAASGNGYWRWLYEWEEVQRHHDSTLASSFQDVGPDQDRNDNGTETAERVARNSLEDSNVFVAAGNAANFVAPGYLQSDYPAATIECQPIAVGTVLTMWEDFRDCDKPAPDLAAAITPRYWFSLPNVPRFVC